MEIYINGDYGRRNYIAAKVVKINNHKQEFGLEGLETHDLWHSGSIISLIIIDLPQVSVMFAVYTLSYKCGL